MDKIIKVVMLPTEKEKTFNRDKVLMMLGEVFTLGLDVAKLEMSDSDNHEVLEVWVKNNL